MTTSNLISDLDALISEEQNPQTMDIDLLSPLEIVQKINEQDKLVASAIEKVLPQIATAIDHIVHAFKQGGRLIYIGAGTSGRLGVLDAVECPPTYGISDQMIQALIAGGDKAVFQAQEGAEDDPYQGQGDLTGIQLQAEDIVVGIAASGRTPYVIGALDYANSIGAMTVALTCNPHSPIAEQAKINITPVVGPEVLTGSTRMKSGTAQKMILNMLSTASMIRLGKSYHNLMVDVRASNEKLQARATRMVMQITGASQDQVKTALELSNNQVKQAIMMILTGLSASEAEQLLDLKNGFLRDALNNSPQL